MIKLNELLEEKRQLDLNISINLVNGGREYRRRADTNINLYLTSYALGREDISYYESAINDYEKAIELLNKTNDALAEAILAYGNAIKEKYLPLHKQHNLKFTEFEENAKKEYEKLVELTLNSNNIRMYYFAMLEQMNLEVRNKVWEQNQKPKRIVIFHSLKSALSHQYLKGVYYFAYKNLVEVWEYNYGRVPDSDITSSFIKDRLEDASGVVFLASPEYDKRREEIIRFEIENTQKLKNENNDPIGVFVLDLGNKEVVRDFKDIPSVFVASDSDKDFEKKIECFLTSIQDIYSCRKFRCKT